MPNYVIDNKKINLTPDEWNAYQSIVRSYTSPTNRGEDLFMDLFEVDDNGIIVFLRPPSKKQTSFEIFLFLISIFNHQQMRLVRAQVNELCEQVRKKFDIT